MRISDWSSDVCSSDLFFGRIGDLVGRKNTFLVTMGLMGLSTFAVGFLPSYASIGIAAPIILVTLRLLQGLAVGGEYGGAATYVAEHAPDGKRGFFTSFIQTTEIGRAHVRTPITNAHHVCRLLLEK